jgi:glycosyltransferase involved in cell wall biosynthesis
VAHPEAIGRRLRVLVVTTLFPSHLQPGHAPFNRRQFSALAELADVDVVGVVPRRLGGPVVRGLRSAEEIDGLPVQHRRYFSIPGLPGLNAGAMAVGLFPCLARRRPAKTYDVLLASYAYPDGCAGMVLGWLLGVPVVVKCHGSDLNRVTDDPLPRLQLCHLLPRAKAVVVVSKHLRDRAQDLGVSPDRLHVVYNGIDRDHFRPRDRDSARRRLGLPLDREIVLYLGHLEEHKGVRDLLEAGARLKQLRPTASLILVGAGALAPEVRRKAATDSGSSHGITAFDSVPHAEVPWWLAAADVLCLPSWTEGMPNVIREAHACGRAVVATAVGGVPEAVHSPELGILVPPRQPAALAQALVRQLDRVPATAATFDRLAAVPSWAESASTLYAVLLRASR